MAIDLFPYETRPHQEAFLETVADLLMGEDQNHLVLEAPTGSGKTICTLAPALEAARERGCRIIYTTRTNSQQLQVIKELREIARSSEDPFLGIGIQGRKNMCLMMRTNPEWREGSPEELSALCGDLKKRSTSSVPEEGCPFFGMLLDGDQDGLMTWVKEELPTIEELVGRCEEEGVCPYELAKGLLPEASVVIAPYIFVFHPQIRNRLHEWTKLPPDNTVLVVDEAHNLPEFVRGLRSLDLGQVSLKRAWKEAREFEDPLLTGNVKSTRLMKVLEDILLYLEREYIMDEDGLVPPDALDTELMTRLGMTSPKLKAMFRELGVHGDLIRETRRKENQLPRSYLGRVASFLSSWTTLEGEAYIKLIRNEAGLVSLQAYCMDPTYAGEVLCSMHRTIHMSGTLAPLEEYRDSIGLPGDTVMERFPNPFPRENLLLVYTDEVTTRYESLRRDPQMAGRIRSLLVDICRKVDRNTAIFFPSFRFMEELCSEGLARELQALDRRVLVEVQGDQSLLMDTLRVFREASTDPSSPSAVLLTVAGGRVSEGMDFPERELELAILVGIPYPKPTFKLKALRNYYDLRFGKGWEYIVKGPTERKILQTIGRLVRSETDRGAAILLDSRAFKFAENLDGLEMERDLASRTRDFFVQGGK